MWRTRPPVCRTSRWTWAIPPERETDVVPKRTLRIAAKVLSVPLGVALAMAGVSPSDAGSNLKAWLDLFGIEGIGDGWTSATDVWVRWVSGGLLATFAIMLIGSYIPAVERHVRKWWSRDSRMPSVVAATPIPTMWMSSDEAREALRRSSLTHLYHAPTQFLATSYGYDIQNRRVALQLRAQGSFRRPFCGSLPVRGRCPGHRRWPVGAVRRGWPCAHATSRRRRVGRWR